MQTFIQLRKVTVKVIDGVVDGNKVGSTIEINEDSAKQFVERGFVTIVETKEKPSQVKKETSPKKPASKAKPKGKQSNDNK